jgi:alpha-glucosidase (family GH31 glycosyl hydrolase)
MCDGGVFSVPIALAIASAAASTMQTMSTAKKAQKSEDQNFINASKTANLANEETDRKAIEEKSARTKEGMLERSRLAVLQGESGLTGNSFDRTETESMFNLGTDIASIESNRDSKAKQQHLQSKGLLAKSKSRRNAITKPDFIGAGLSIAGAGVDAWSTSKKGGSNPFTAK